MRWEYFLIAMVVILLLSGCDGQGRSAAFTEMAKRCDGPISMRVKVGEWDDYVIFECEMSAEDFDD